MNLKKLIWNSAIIVLLFSACSKDLLNEEPPHLLAPETLFKSKVGFEGAVNALYDQARRERSGNQLGEINSMMLTMAFIGVDNAYANYRAPFEDIFNLWQARNNSLETGYSRVWAWLYQTINACNSIINRAEVAEIDWTAAERDQIIAEARCMRALAYRHLTFLWGDVPLTLEESSGAFIKTDYQRTPAAEVRKVIEEDLLFAEQHLPETSPNQGKLIRGVAQHYLAELYLTTNENEKAKAKAELVTNNANYKLITARYGVNKANPGTAFTDMFLDGNSNRTEGNTEALWVIQNELFIKGGEGNNLMRRVWANRYYSIIMKRGTANINPFAVTAENGGRGIGRFGPTRFALDLYGPGDDRGSGFAWRLYYILRDPTKIPTGYKLNDTVWVTRNTNEKLSNPDWPHPRKWDYTYPANIEDDRQYGDQIYLRSADTWLLLAEAKFKLNDRQGAADAINVLRARAHATPVLQNQVTLDFILDERSRELFSEEHRRYTLLRTNKWVERTKLYNKISAPYVVERDKLFPIPQDMIDANLTAVFPQNPGY
jgi:hypothetical protein